MHILLLLLLSVGIGFAGCTTIPNGRINKSITVTIQGVTRDPEAQANPYYPFPVIVVINYSPDAEPTEFASEIEPQVKRPMISGPNL